ncbi:MAG: hypothetical protein ACOC0Q_02940 [Wenzhouxiangella sp.]
MGIDDPDPADASGELAFIQAPADAFEKIGIAAIDIGAGTGFIDSAVQIDQQPVTPSDLLVQLQIELALAGFVVELLINIRALLGYPFRDSQDVEQAWFKLLDYPVAETQFFTVNAGDQYGPVIRRGF